MLMLRALFRLPLRQTEGLVSSIIALLKVGLAVPDYSTISRRARTVRLPQPSTSTGCGLHLLIDSTGLKLCGSGDWLAEKHGTRTRRSWRKLHLGVDAATGRIVASLLALNQARNRVYRLQQRPRAQPSGFQAGAKQDRTTILGCETPSRSQQAHHSCRKRIPSHPVTDTGFTAW